MLQVTFLIILVAPPFCRAFNWSSVLTTPSHTPLIEATNDVIVQFFTAETDRIYIRRWATDERNVPFQNDVMSSILRHVQPRITAQVETAHAKVLNSSRAFNIFLVDDHEAFRLISDKMRVQMYDYAGYFLVILSDSSANSFRSVQLIMDDLWSHYIVNVGVLLAYDDMPETALYYTYFPFGEGYCEQVRPLLWKIFTHGRFEKEENEFYPPKMNTLYGCPLKLATFEIPPFMMFEYGFDGNVVRTNGLDGIVARVLSQMLNFTMNVVVVDPPEWGVTASLGSNTGASRYIRNRLANFTIGYWSTTYSRNRYMGHSVAYYTSLMTTAVPPGPPYDSLEILALPFKYIIWSLISTILTVAIVVIVIIKHHKPIVQRFVFGRSITTPLLNTFNIFFGGNLHRSPTRNFSRTLLAFWLFYCIIIRTSYTGALFKFLQNQPNKTVSMVIPHYIAAGYHIRMCHNYSYIFDEFSNFDLQKNLKLISWMDFINNGIDELQHPKTRHVMLAPVETIAFLNRALTKKGLFLRTNWDRVVLSKLTIYSQRSAPVLQPFNTVLGRLNAAGFIEQWASAYSQTVFLEDYTTADEPKRLSVAQLSGCFKLLLAGYGISFAVYLGEYLTWRLKKQKQQQQQQMSRKKVTFRL